MAEAKTASSASPSLRDASNVSSDVRDGPIAGPSRPTRPARPPFLPAAAQPEIIRANQKDLYYLGELTEQVEDAARSLFGTRRLQSWTHEMSVFSRLAYFSLTTLLGSQTLGEEYCDILQYNAGDRKAPSVVRRASLVLLHILAPYACAKFYADLRRKVRERRQIQQQIEASGESSEGKSMTSSWLSHLDLPPWEEVFDGQFMAIHLAVFYLTGRYYHAAKRALGIRYLSTQSSSALAASKPPSYEILGLLMAIQLLVRLILAARSAAPAQPPPTLSEKSKKETEQRRKVTVDGITLDSLRFDPENPSPREDDADEDPDAPYDASTQARRCTLCLNTRLDPTATECGHVFCWECIVGWAREKAECPLCRQSIGNLSALLPVYNL